MKQRFIEILCCLFLVSDANNAFAGDGPKRLLQKKIFVLQQILSIQPQNQDEFQEWRQQIIRESYDFLDIQEMGRNAIGQYADKMKGREPEYYAAFLGNVLNQFTETLKIYRQFEFQGLKEVVDHPNGRAGVASVVIIPLKGGGIESYPVNFQFSSRTGNWLVWDIVVYGISLNSNFRSQFDGIIRKHGFDYLIRDMQAKGLKQNESK